MDEVIIMSSPLYWDGTNMASRLVLKYIFYEGKITKFVTHHQCFGENDPPFYVHGCYFDVIGGDVKGAYSSAVENFGTRFKAVFKSGSLADESLLLRYLKPAS